ncbi:Outer envelope protein [Thalictrum thalictroides]|uniref:Outer envelope protein n=1 Tax=Thalictrum thalictroides TaxID=46969 RepID=A0A7J6XBX8_THATH|nr:Outer envelope protein [Thalictrum thalictroides]
MAGNNGDIRFITSSCSSIKLAPFLFSSVQQYSLLDFSNLSLSYQAGTFTTRESLNTFVSSINSSLLSLSSLNLDNIKNLLLESHFFRTKDEKKERVFVQGFICEGANALPTYILEDIIRQKYRKFVDIRCLNDFIHDSVNGWYTEHGFSASISNLEVVSDGIVKIKVSEAKVNDITLCFLDKENGNPITGNTRHDIIVRHISTKKGQVYNLIKAQNDVETVWDLGIMKHVSIVPQPGDDGNIDLRMNLVEDNSFSFTHKYQIPFHDMFSIRGFLLGLFAGFAYFDGNLFGRNQKLNVIWKRNKYYPTFGINWTDPWIGGDKNATSRSIVVDYKRALENLVFGNQLDDTKVHIHRFITGLVFSRPFSPKWRGTAGLNYKRAGACDDTGSLLMEDSYCNPLTATGHTHDEMLLAKVEILYSHFGNRESSALGFNMEQGLPVMPNWLCFNRIYMCVRKSILLGPANLQLHLFGGHVVGSFPPHEAFAIGGTESVRGYKDGAVGSGRSYMVGSGELSFPMFGPVKSFFLFADYGSDLGSGSMVHGNPAGARYKPGRGYGYGVGVLVNTPFLPFILEFATNDQHRKAFNFRFT